MRWRTKPPPLHAHAHRRAALQEAQEHVAYPAHVQACVCEFSHVLQCRIWCYELRAALQEAKKHVAYPARVQACVCAIKPCVAMQDLVL